MEVGAGGEKPQALKCKVCGSEPSMRRGEIGMLYHCSWKDCPNAQYSSCIVGWTLNEWNRTNG